MSRGRDMEQRSCFGYSGKTSEAKATVKGEMRFKANPSIEPDVTRLGGGNPLERTTTPNLA